VYTYDANGNRLTATDGLGTLNAAYDGQDRLVQYGTTSFSYDADGSLASRDDGGSTTTYRYDALGALLSVGLPSGATID
jgi:YD repeat-containing protein